MLFPLFFYISKNYSVTNWKSFALIFFVDFREYSHAKSSSAKSVIFFLVSYSNTFFLSCYIFFMNSQFNTKRMTRLCSNLSISHLKNNKWCLYVYRMISYLLNAHIFFDTSLEITWVFTVFHCITDAEWYQMMTKFIV